MSCSIRFLRSQSELLKLLPEGAREANSHGPSAKGPGSRAMISETLMLEAANASIQ